MIANQKLEKYIFSKILLCSLVFAPLSVYSQTISLKNLQHIAKQTNVIYKQYLQKQMQLYVRSKLDLPQGTCQQNNDDFGCTTYQKQNNTWSIQLILQEALKISSLDFGRLWLFRQGNGQRSLIIKNQTNQYIRFSFDGAVISGWKIKNHQRSLTNQDLEALLLETSFIYRDQLKRAMIQYQNQQIEYPTEKCDARMLRLGCVVLTQFQHYTQMKITFSKEKKETFLGFYKLLYKRQQDENGIIYLYDSQQSEVFIPIVNDKLQSLHTFVNKT